MSPRSLTLLALATGAFAADAVPAPAAPAAPAAEAPAQKPVFPTVSDPGLSLTISGQLQGRAEYSKSRTAADQPYDIAGGGTNGKSDDLDFYLRRVRVGVKGTWSGLRFGVTLSADNEERGANSSVAANTNSRAVQVYNATVAKDFKGETVTQTLKGGLDNVWYNSNGYAPSAWALMPAGRVTDQFIGALRGTGLSYKVVAPYVAFGVDVQNNLGDDSANPSNHQAEGLFYSARAEFTPEGDWAIKPNQFAESFAGKQGKGLVVALEAAYNAHDVVAASTPANNTWQDTLGLATEVLVHVNGLTALAELRQDRVIQNSENGGEVPTTPANGNSFYREAFVLQAGYAMPCPIVSGAFIEPVARYSYLDLNKDNTTEANSYGTGADYAKGSGNQIEVGANWYLSGAGVYSNKVSLLYAHWASEDAGNGVAGADYQAKADVVRAQYQLLF